MAKTIPVNEHNQPIGESHPRAQLSDRDVDRIRDLREDYDLTYDQLSFMFGVHKMTIASICQYRTRAQTPFGWKTLKEDK